jgi:hypothetical protein
MKNFTLLVCGMVLLGVLHSSQVCGYSASMPDGDRLETELSEKEIKVFPNPSDGRFQLTLDYQGASKVTAKVYDITGKQVKDISEDLVKENTSITANVDLDSPKAGIYFLRVTVGTHVLTKKFIVR